MELMNCRIGTLARVISELRGNKDFNVYALSKETNLTYSHLHNILKLMEKEELIRIVKKGRENTIEITPKLRKLKLYEFSD